MHRLELRRSPMLVASLAGLGMAGALGWALSDAPAVVSAGGAIFGLAWAARLALNEIRQCPLAITLGPGDVATIDGIDAEHLAVEWRGAFVSLRWIAAGRRYRRLAFPDALSRDARRELRLWSLASRERPRPAAVAP